MISQKVSCVAAILRNSKGRVLLQQREANPALSFPGYWTLPGGKVEKGETPEEAVKREVMEEIELEVALRQWKIYERPGPGLVRIVQYVYTGTTEQTVSSLACNEGQALRFVCPAELGELPIAYGFGSLLQEYWGNRSTGPSPRYLHREMIDDR